MRKIKNVAFRVTADAAEMRVRDTAGTEDIFQLPHVGILTVFSAAADAAFKAMQLANTDGGGSMMAAFTVKDIEAYKSSDGSPLIVLQLQNGARLPLALTFEQAEQIQTAAVAVQASGSRH